MNHGLQRVHLSLLEVVEVVWCDQVLLILLKSLLELTMPQYNSKKRKKREKRKKRRKKMKERRKKRKRKMRERKKKKKRKKKKMRI